MADAWQTHLPFPAAAGLCRSAEAAGLAQVGLPPSELGTCSQGWLQMGALESLHPPRPRAPGLLWWSVPGHVASGAPQPALGGGGVVETVLPWLLWA